MSAPTRELVSGEGVALDLDHAGVASRMLAAAVDAAMEVAGVAVAAMLVLPAIGTADAGVAVLLVLVVLAFGVYPVLCEWLGQGRTIGKMCLGLRAVRDDGGPLSFRHALVRGLTGLLLEKPGVIVPLGTAAGVLTMIFTPNSKRIGDAMAGTFVLNERAADVRGAQATTYWVVPALQGWVGRADLSRVEDRFALALRHFALRAKGMDPAARERMQVQLRSRILATVTPAPPADCPTWWLISAILAERRRRGQLEVQRATGYAYSAPGPAQWAGPGAGHPQPLAPTPAPLPPTGSPAAFSPPS